MGKIRVFWHYLGQYQLAAIIIVAVTYFIINTVMGGSAAAIITMGAMLVVALVTTIEARVEARDENPLAVTALFASFVLMVFSAMALAAVSKLLSGGFYLLAVFNLVLVTRATSLFTDKALETNCLSLTEADLSEKAIWLSSAAEVVFVFIIISILR